MVGVPQTTEGVSYVRSVCGEASSAIITYVFFFFFKTSIKKHKDKKDSIIKHTLIIFTGKGMLKKIPSLKSSIPLAMSNHKG